MLYVVLLSIFGATVITVVMLQVEYRKREERYRVKKLEHEVKYLKYILMRIGSGESGNPALDAQEALGYDYKEIG